VNYIYCHACGICPASVPVGAYGASIIVPMVSYLDLHLVCPAYFLGAYSLFILMTTAFVLPLSHSVFNSHAYGTFTLTLSCLKHFLGEDEFMCQVWC